MPRSVAAAALPASVTLSRTIRDIGLMRRIALCALVLLATTSAAFAHAFLERAVPAVGSTVRAPSELRLTFTERVEPLFCRVTIQGASGQQIAAGPLHAAKHGLQLVLTLPQLAPGSYTVTWHATSADTHKTEGSFHFIVAAP